MIDLHTHILPGFDDGVRSLEEARDLARLSAAEGIRTIAATPHVRDDYPTSAVRMERGVAVLRADLAEAGVEIEIVHGGEVALDRFWDLSEDEVRSFTFGQAGRALLLEFPYTGWSDLLAPTVGTLVAAGITPLLAHPERNDAVQAMPERLLQLVEEGAHVQLTAGSVAGRLGRDARACAFRLLELGAAHVIASDAHSPDVRAGGLAAAVEALADPELARRLTRDGPAALLAAASAPG